MNESLRIPPRKNKYAEGEREGEVSVQCVIDIAIRVLNGGNKEACATYNSGNLVGRRSPGRLTNMTQLGVNSFSLDQATKTILSTLRTLVVVFSTKVNRKMLAQLEGNGPVERACGNDFYYRSLFAPVKWQLSYFAIDGI